MLWSAFPELPKEGNLKFEVNVTEVNTDIGTPVILQHDLD
jgi:hypothetical protein